MPTLSGPEYLNGQFSVAADGTVSLTTPPLSTAGGTISPGPVIIRNTVAAPQPSTAYTLLTVANEASATQLLLDAYSSGSTAHSGWLGGRRARGTAAAPTAVQAFDTLLLMNGSGYGATGYSAPRAQILFTARDNFTDTAQGTNIGFLTTTLGTTNTLNRMTIGQGVVIGNLTPTMADPGQGGLVLNANAAPPPPSISVGAGLQLMGADTFPGYIDMVGIGAGPTVFARRANGTGAAPTAVQAGQTIAGFQARGYGATAWSGNRGNIQFVSTENWTDAAQGAALAFVTGANGTTATAEAMRIDHNGNVGIGTTTPGERLEIAGGGLKIDGQLAANRASCIGIEQPSTTMSRVIVWGPDVNTLGTFQLLQQSSTAAHQSVAVQVNNLGYVGIGTTTANSPLTVAGNVEIAGGSGSSTLLNIHYTGSQWIASATGTGGIVGLDSNGLVFYSNPSGTVGTAVVPTMKMAVRNDGTCANTSGAWGVISDASIKENVQPYTRGLDAIVALKPVQFRYVKGTPFAEPDKPSRQLFGLLADEVKPHVPEIVGTMMATVGKKEGVELATLEPGNLIYALINAVKELHAKVAALEGATVH